MWTNGPLHKIFNMSCTNIYNINISQYDTLKPGKILTIKIRIVIEMCCSFMWDLETGWQSGTTDIWSAL